MTEYQIAKDLSTRDAPPVKADKPSQLERNTLDLHKEAVSSKLKVLSSVADEGFSCVRVAQTSKAL